MSADGLGLVGTMSHVYDEVGPKRVAFVVHGELTSVGHCDYVAARTTVCNSARSFM